MTSFFRPPPEKLPEDHFADHVGFYTSHRRDIPLKGESIKEAVMQLSLLSEDRVKDVSLAPTGMNGVDHPHERSKGDLKVSAKSAIGISSTKAGSSDHLPQQLKADAKESEFDRGRPPIRGSFPRLKRPNTKVFPSCDPDLLHTGASEYLANAVRSAAILGWSLPSLRVILHTRPIKDQKVFGGLEIVTDHRILEHLLQVEFPSLLLERVTRETDPLHDKSDWQLLKPSNIAQIPYITLKVNDIEVFPEVLAYLMHKKRHELMKSLLPAWAIKALQPVWSEDTAPLGRSSSREKRVDLARRVCQSLSPVRALRSMKSLTELLTTEARADYLDRKALVVRQRFGVKVEYKELENITKVIFKLRTRVEDLLGPDPASILLDSFDDSPNESPIRILFDLRNLVTDLHETMTVMMHYENSQVERPFSTASLDPEYTHRMRRPPELPVKSTDSVKSAKRSFWNVPGSLASLHCLHAQHLE